MEAGPCIVCHADHFAPAVRHYPLHVAAAAVAVPVMMLVMAGPDIEDDVRLEHGGREVRAEVISAAPTGHGAVRALYLVDGRALTVDTGGGRGNPDAALLRAGDSLWVTYLPADQTVATGGRRPVNVLREAVVGIAGVTVIAVCTVAVLAYLSTIEIRWRGRRDRPATADAGESETK